MLVLFVLHPHQHGWRWAIYAATRDQFDAAPLSNCVNAGFELSQQWADVRGQDCLYTLLSFCQRLGINLRTEAVTLDTDPLPNVELEAKDITPELVQMGPN